MKRIMSGRDALTMGVAIIAASLVLVMSLTSSPLIGMALQNTETPTEAVDMTATPASSDATAMPATSSSPMMAACVDAAVPSTDATADATAETLPATVDASATADMTTPSTDTTATSVPTSFLGVVVAAVGDCGVRVAQVFADSPAFDAQLAVGDVIVAVNGVPVTDLTSMQTTRPDGMMNYASLTTAGFFTAIHALPPGTEVVLTVQRGDQQLDLVATLVALATDAVSSDLEGTPSIDSTPDLSATVATVEATVEATATP